MKTEIKKVTNATAKEEAENALKDTYSLLDKMVSKKIIPRNRAIITNARFFSPKLLFIISVTLSIIPYYYSRNKYIICFIRTLCKIGINKELQGSMHNINEQEENSK